MNTRIISFGGESVSVEYESYGREIVDYLFGDINEETVETPSTRFSIHYRSYDEVLILKRDETEIYSGNSKSELASMLMDQCLFHLVTPNAAGMLIHCAVLVRNGIGILLPGTSGAGKSTLSAWLTRQGFDYLTDELAFISNGTKMIQSFTRPFNIKTQALPVIRDNLQIDVYSESLLANERATLIPHRQVNPDYQYTTPELGMILFPRFMATKDLQLAPLSPALTGLELMQCLINARNLNADGFPEIARLARQVPAYSMTYGGFDQLGEHFYKVLDKVLLVK